MANKFLDYISEKEKEYNLKPGILKHLIQVESGGWVKAKSPKGAIGLTQLMPDTAKIYGVDPYDPMQNIEGAARHLSDLLYEFDGSYAQALAAYNAGSNRDSIKNRNWNDLPYETKNYVKQFLPYIEKGSKKLTKKHDFSQKEIDKVLPNYDKWKIDDLIEDVISKFSESETGKRYKEKGYDAEDVLVDLAVGAGIGLGGKLGATTLKLPIKLGKTGTYIVKGLYRTGKSAYKTGSAQKVKESREYTPKAAKNLKRKMMDLYRFIDKEWRTHNPTKPIKNIKKDILHKIDIKNIN